MKRRTRTLMQTMAAAAAVLLAVEMATAASAWDAWNDTWLALKQKYGGYRVTTVIIEKAKESGVAYLHITAQASNTFQAVVWSWDDGSGTWESTDLQLHHTTTNPREFLMSTLVQESAGISSFTLAMTFYVQAQMDNGQIAKAKLSSLGGASWEHVPYESYYGGWKIKGKLIDAADLPAGIPR